MIKSITVWCIFFEALSKQPKKERENGFGCGYRTVKV